MARLTKANKALLGAIVISMQNADAPYHMATQAELKNLVDNGLVEVNEEITDGEKVAVRATEKGLAEAPPATEKETTPVSKTETPPAVAPTFELHTATAPAIKKRASRNSSVYPFDRMDNLQYFFIPATEDRPNVKKSMASTVSSANKRYAREGMDQRKFQVIALKANETEPGTGFTAPTDGAMVQRIA